MNYGYERNLRGKALARQVLHLNGHQKKAKFIIFEPYWFFMILSFALSGLIPILKYIGIAGVTGFLFEVSLWAYYFIKTRQVLAYPGLKAWWSTQVRRKIMGNGRSAGHLGNAR